MKSVVHVYYTRNVCIHMFALFRPCSHMHSWFSGLVPTYSIWIGRIYRSWIICIIITYSAMKSVQSIYMYFFLMHIKCMHIQYTMCNVQCICTHTFCRHGWILWWSSWPRPLNCLVNTPYRFIHIANCLVCKLSQSGLNQSNDKMKYQCSRHTIALGWCRVFAGSWMYCTCILLIHVHC